MGPGRPVRRAIHKPGGTQSHHRPLGPVRDLSRRMVRRHGHAAEVHSRRRLRGRDQSRRPVCDRGAAGVDDHVARDRSQRAAARARRDVGRVADACVAACAALSGCRLRRRALQPCPRAHSRERLGACRTAPRAPAGRAADRRRTQRRLRSGASAQPCPAAQHPRDHRSRAFLHCPNSLPGDRRCGVPDAVGGGGGVLLAAHGDRPSGPGHQRGRCRVPLAVPCPARPPA